MMPMKNQNPCRSCWPISAMDGRGVRAAAADVVTGEMKHQSFQRDLLWSANTFNDIVLLSGKRARRSLAEQIKINETNAGGADGQQCRIVGLTLETRPDTIGDLAAVRRLRELGPMRLQIGVQPMDDAMLS